MKLALCLVFCLGLALARVEEWSSLADNYETSRTIYDSELCHVYGSTVKSFDNVKQRFPLTSQFKVLAQDCSENQRCVILMRKLSENSDLKVFKIISENNVILITPVSESDDQLRIIVNDREFSIENVEQIETLYQLPIRVYREGSELKVELLTCGVTVSFNGLTCTIERCSRKSVPLCGPCGKVSMDTEYHNSYNKRGLYNKRGCNKFSCQRNSIFDDLHENKPYWEQRERSSIFDDDHEDLTLLKNFFHDDEEVLSRKHKNFEPSYLNIKDQEKREGATYWGLKDNEEYENDLFQSNLYEDDAPVLKSTRRQERPIRGQTSKRASFWETRKPASFWETRKPATVWGLDKEARKPARSFWGLDDEQEKRNDASNWGLNEEDRTLENFDDVFQSILYKDHVERPNLKSMRRQQRPVWGQSQKRNNFWNLDDELPETRKFWGVEDEQSWGNVHEERKSLVTPVLKHKIVEVENKVCFSIERVSKCPVDHRPVNKVEKRVRYACLNRQDPQVNELQTRIRRGESVVSVLDRQVPAKTRVEIVPTKCAKLF